MCRGTQKATNSKSTANKRRDPELLQDRATTYRLLHRYADEEKDLQELYDLGYRKYNSMFDIAQARVNSGVFDERTFKLLRKPVEETIAARTNPEIKSQIRALEPSVYALTLLGDDWALQSLKPGDDLIDEEIDLARGIRRREQGDTKDSLMFLKRSKTACDGESDVYNSARAQSFMALLKLDEKDPSGAIATQPTETDDPYFLTDPTHRLVMGWIAFEKGDMHTALDECNTILSTEDDSFRDFTNAGVLSSAHYLRAMIYNQSGQHAQKTKDLAEYDKYSALGKVFIPKPYRNALRR